MSKLLQAGSADAALEDLHQRGCTDRLPVVIPTPERIAQLLQRDDVDADLVVGEMGPRQGAASVELIAASAVMAGCLPEHFPVVIAAIKAICRPEFDLTEVVQTTHCLAPLLVVNGQARHDCGDLNSGAGILGPDNRANAGIGRAVNLACINIGGARAGVTDLAVFSSPGKFTACFAEAEEQSPFEPYHVSRGFESQDSVVSVIAVEAPHSVICEISNTPQDDARRLIALLAGVIANPGSNLVYRGGYGGVVVTLCPEHAMLLANAGYDRRKIQTELANQALVSRGTAKLLYGRFMYDEGQERDFLRANRDPDQIMLVVASGMGTYSMVMPSWVYAPHGNLQVSETINVYPSCDLRFCN